MYQMNKIIGWYIICRQYRVVKDIRRYVIKRGFLKENNMPQYSDLAAVYSPFLSPRQKFDLFNSTDRIHPSVKRELLRVPYKTIDERYVWLRNCVIVFGPVMLILLLVLLRH